MPNENESNKLTFIEKIGIYSVIFVLGVNQTVDFFDNFMRFESEIMQPLKWVLRTIGFKEILMNLIN